MSYQVLARRLRPKGFAALVGQDHVVRALCNGLDSGRVHHAYLFTGTRGVGKTTIARILAKCLNCEAGVSSAPCGTCSICREVEENRFMDLIEVDAASRTKVDDTRELLDNAQYKPSRGRFKVYLIDEVHMLSASSFNAFLKTLEEPPEHVKFLLATTDPKKVPVTVLSRCLQFQLKNIGRDEIARYIGEVLTAEGIEHEPDALRIIAKSAQGSMRDALSITDQAIAYGGGLLAASHVAAMVGAVGRDEIGAIIEALASGEPRRVLELSDTLADKAADFRSVLTELLEALHGMAVDQALGEAEDSGLSPETVQLYYQIALIGYRDLFVGPDPKAGFEMTLLRMLAFAPNAQAATNVPPAAGVPVVSEPKPGRTPADTPEVPSSTAATPSAPPGPVNPQLAHFVEPSAGEREGPAPRMKEPSAGEREGPVLPTGTVSAEDAEETPPAGKKVDETSGLKTSAQVDAPHSESRESSAAVSTEEGANYYEKWYELVGRLPLKGIDRMIVEHSLLVECREANWRLVLDRKQASLLSGAEMGAIERALADVVGEAIHLVVDVGDPQQETPTARNHRLAQERQVAARRDFAENPKVQSFLELFDGRLEDVRPLPMPETKTSGQRA